MVKPAPHSDDTDQQVEARVDAMMNPEPKPAPEIDIFADQPKTAPVLHTKPAKVEPVPAEPVATQLPTEAAPTTSEPAPITIKELDIDTPDSDAAINDIVAQEADEVLAAEDMIANNQSDAGLAESTKHGHPIFWFFVVLLAIVAVIAAVVLTNPNLSF